MAVSPAIQLAGSASVRPSRLGPSDRWRVYPCYGAASIPENVGDTRFRCGRAGPARASAIPGPTRSVAPATAGELLSREVCGAPDLSSHQGFWRGAAWSGGA